MNIFKWSNYFVTGQSRIDDQHKQLVNLLNTFGAYISENKNLESLKGDVKLGKILQELKEYTAYHFREEEVFMANFSVDSRHFTSHMYKHQYFITEINFFIEKDNIEYIDLIELFDFLISWLTTHILGVDMLMIKQYEYIQKGHTPEEAYEKVYNEDCNRSDVLITALKKMVNLLLAKNRKLSILNTELQKKVDQYES